MQHYSVDEKRVAFDVNFVDTLVDLCTLSVSSCIFFANCLLVSVIVVLSKDVFAIHGFGSRVISNSLADYCWLND